MSGMFATKPIMECAFYAHILLGDFPLCFIIFLSLSCIDRITSAKLSLLGTGCSADKDMHFSVQVNSTFSPFLCWKEVDRQGSWMEPLISMFSSYGSVVGSPLLCSWSYYFLSCILAFGIEFHVEWLSLCSYECSELHAGLYLMLAYNLMTILSSTMFCFYHDWMFLLHSIVFFVWVHMLNLNSY